MFISIPKDFFVPVVFGDGFTLNLENMEFDTERNIEKNAGENNKANLDVKANQSIVSPFNNADLYAVLDEEYVNSAIGIRKK